MYMYVYFEICCTYKHVNLDWACSLLLNNSFLQRNKCFIIKAHDIKTRVFLGSFSLPPISKQEVTPVIRKCFIWSIGGELKEG